MKRNLTNRMTCRFTDSPEDCGIDCENCVFDYLNELFGTKPREKF